MVRHYALICCILIGHAVTGQSSSPDLAKRINGIHHARSLALIRGDVAGVVGILADNPVCQPEFHPPLYGRKAIADYYRNWAGPGRTRSLHKAITNLTVYKDHIVETGSFNWIFHRGKDSAVVYKGKYLSVWKLSKNNLQLVSEIWGTNHPMDASVFSFIRKQSHQPPPGAAVAVAKEVTGRNSRITELVKNREGTKHADEFFTDDALYMTYDEPVFDGIAKIREYFSGHERPGDVTVDSLHIATAQLVDLGNAVIEYGYYTIKVRWNGGGGGTFSGKSTNVWKRNADGILMLHRQMVNHD